MGIYERDYERQYSGSGYESEGGGLQLRMPTSVVGRLILANFAVFVVQLLVGEPFTDLFGLQPDWFRRPWLAYQLVTYGFLHSTGNLGHILFNMYGLWLFGRELETRLGRREFAILYFASLVVGGALWSGVEAFAGARLPVIGASGAVVAVTILFACYYPHKQILFMFFLPMPMWMLGLLVVGSDMMNVWNRTGSEVAYMVHLGGAAFALAYYFGGWRLSNFAPEELKMPSFKRRPKLRVHREEPEDDKTSRELDRILEKISAQGQDSLSRSERKFLEQASRNYKSRRQ